MSEVNMGDAREQLVAIHVQSWIDHDRESGPWMVDALLANPDVVLRALIAAGHASLSLMDGVPVYIVEVKS